MKSPIKKIKNYIIISVILLLLIPFFSAFILNTLNKQEATLNELNSDVEDQWRSDIHEYLLSIQNDLQTNVTNGQINPYDDIQIKEWITDNVKLTKINNNNIESFDVISLGNTYHIYELTTLKPTLIEYGLSIEESNLIINTELNDMVNNINKNASITNEIIDIEALRTSKIISSKYNISFEDIYSIIKKAFFDYNNVLMSNKMENVNFDDKNLSFDYNDNEGKKIWVESVLIPDGILGFDDQPQTENGMTNIKYKKIMISISINSTRLLEKNNYHIEYYMKLKNLSLLLLSCIEIGSLLAVFFMFKSTLIFNKIKANVNSEDEDN